MKHSTEKGGNCAKIKKNNPNSDVKLAGSKEIKPSTGKAFPLAGATKVEGKRKKG